MAAHQLVFSLAANMQALLSKKCTSLSEQHHWNKLLFAVEHFFLKKGF